MGITVSVYCAAYNHEKYIRDALEGFVSQKTDFKYRVFVHDDASTDGTADIIREYASKYPDIIEPILQSENQYSKGVSIFLTYLYPRFESKYIAVCEGDDYWCDPDKLRRQVEWMEAHPDYSLCAHNSRIIDCRSGESELFNDIGQDRDFSFEEILAGGKSGRTVFHTSSILYRAEYALMPEGFRVKGVGDSPRFLYSAARGRIRCFADVMSVYRANVPGSWTTRMQTGPDLRKRREEHWNNFKRMLEFADGYTDKQYSEMINLRIRKGDFSILMENGELKKIRESYGDLYSQLSLKGKAFLFMKARIPGLLEKYRRLKMEK